VYTLFKIIEINAKEARGKFSFLLNNVEKGDEVVILRRGKKVARLIPSQRESRCLPSLKGFRASIKTVGKPLSTVVLKTRVEERY
jgi:prevent-host-death family protein